MDDDDSALRLISEIGAQLAQQTRPNKDFLVKSLRVSPIPLFSVRASQRFCDSFLIRQCRCYLAFEFGFDMALWFCVSFSTNFDDVAMFRTIFM